MGPANNTIILSGMNLWRARCVERRTPGSVGGSEKRTSRKADTALRPDLYVNDRPNPERRATTPSDRHGLSPCLQLFPALLVVPCPTPWPVGQGLTLSTA